MGPGSRKSSASSNSIKSRGIAEATTSVPPPIVAYIPPSVPSPSTGTSVAGVIISGEASIKAFVSVSLSLGDQQLAAQFQEIPLDLRLIEAESVSYIGISGISLRTIHEEAGFLPWILP